MSRRPPNPGADRAAANQATLKTLVKIESNKSCADCKRNKHPRWASWNLGIFVCIRCSGIHRGMGTHISRVKSVDLDAWTDEQLASMVKWGNARANKYWEAKLAPGHMPSESKMENFIRTKYDSKRWVMDGGMPDPSTLDGEDDNVPLAVVQEQAKIQRAGSLKTTGGAPLAKKPVSDIDMFGDVPADPAPRSSSAQPQATARAAPPPQAARKQGGDSLLGFDFFNSTSSNPPSRPASAAPSAIPTAGTSRPDLKQSILSLYASVPKSAPPAQDHSRSGSLASPSFQSPPQSSLGGLSDDFGGLSFGGPTSTQSPPITSPTSKPAAPVATQKQNTSSGGSFFDAKPHATKPASAQPSRGFSSDADDFGGFEAATSPPPIVSSSTTSRKAPASTSNGLDDLFDFSEPAAPAPAPKSTASAMNDSPFNLSAPKPTPAPVSKPLPPVNAAAFMAAVPTDPWGASDDNAWSSNPAPSAPAPSTRAPLAKATPVVAPTSPSLNDWGNDWGSTPSTAATTTTAARAAPAPVARAPQITADEDFGGWESSAGGASTSVAAPAPRTQTSAPKPFAANVSDAFDNPWE